MDKHDYDPVLDSPYDCDFCRDTGKLDGSDYYDCTHCGVAQERVALEQRVPPEMRHGAATDVLYREVRTAKRTAYAVAAAEMVLLRDKQMQAERRAAELERELAELRKGAVVPVGWKLVPYEPDQAMMNSGLSAILHYGKREVGLIYSSMLNSAPLPPVVQEKDGE